MIRHPKYFATCTTVARVAIVQMVFFVALFHGMATPKAAGIEEKASLSSGNYLPAAARLTVRFRGYPELSGEYRIGPKQTISVPVLGRFSVDGKSAAQLEQVLAERASKIRGKTTYVTVEIARYKSVYVMGSVRQSGAIEWQPNLNVLQAVALAGGYAPDLAAIIAASPSGQGVNPLFAARSTEKLKRDLARFARLVAQRDGKKKLTTPNKLVELVGAKEAKRLIDAEWRILLSTEETRAQKLDVLLRGISAEKEQISSLRTQLDRLSYQLVKRQKQLLVVSSLRKEGVVPQDRLLEQEIRVSDLQEKVASIEASIARSTAALASLELQKVSVERSNHEQVLEGIARIEEEISNAGIELDSIMKTAKKSSETSTPSEEPESRFKIVRGSSSKPIPVSSQTILEPGDVLLIAKQ